MTPETRALFVIAERIGSSVTNVERMSTREIMDWLTYCAPPAANDAVDLNALTPQQRREMFS